MAPKIEIDSRGRLTLSLYQPSTSVSPQPLSALNLYLLSGLQLSAIQPRYSARPVSIGNAITSGTS